jgi:ABC-2 type transport system permease protein
MSAELGLAQVTPSCRFPSAVVGLRTGRRAVRSGALWGLVFGITVAASALGYSTAYKSASERARFAALWGSNAGLAAINGPARKLETVAGYTAWKSFMFLIILGGVWGLLTGTRLLRGEEDAGRWELLLAGQTTRQRAARQALAGLGGGLVALWAVTALITLAVAQSSKVRIGTGPALYFSLALVATPAVFLAAGALASQLAATRRQAAGYAGAVLGASYALRLVADSGSSLGWLRWVTPLGWAEELQPLTTPHPFALLPILALVALLAGLAAHLAGVRDLGASVLPDRTRPAAGARLLARPLGLALRLALTTLLAWASAIGAMALLMGYIAKQGGTALTSSASVERVISRLGFQGGSAAAYLGFTFLIIAVMIAFLAAGQISAVRTEEAEGRLEQLLVRPLSRASWLLGRIALIAAALIAGALVAGVFSWAGAASQNAGVSLASLLAAAFNVVPPALCLLGIAVLGFGLVPRATAAVAYGVLVWSLLVDLVGGAFGNANHWLLDTSVFHHMSSAPAVSPDWRSSAVLVGLALGTCALGVLAFVQRDLAGE